MNYRHAFHAGNFADLAKHAALGLLVRHLAEKPKGFCVLDTHAGLGEYDLLADAAARTGEWRGGIGRVFATP
jgi:23S rRNA (adenine2030-N6)-methyltransferase